MASAMQSFASSLSLFSEISPGSMKSVLMIASATCALSVASRYFCSMADTCKKRNFAHPWLSEWKHPEHIPIPTDHLCFAVFFFVCLFVFPP